MACHTNITAMLINLYKKIYLFSLPVTIIVAILFLALSILQTCLSFKAYDIKLDTTMIIELVSFGFQILYYSLILIMFRKIVYTSLDNLDQTDVKAPYNLILFILVVLMGFLNYLAYIDTNGSFRVNLIQRLIALVQPTIMTLLDHIPYLIIGIITTYICNQVKLIHADTDLSSIENILVYYNSFKEASGVSLLIFTSYHTIALILMAYNIVPILKGTSFLEQQLQMIYQLTTTTLKSILGLLYVCLSLGNCHSTVKSMADILRYIYFII